LCLAVAQNLLGTLVAIAVKLYSATVGSARLMFMPAELKALE
jgi:hypothetical protein